MASRDNPRRFFDAYVRRSYEEWLKAPTDLLRASCAVHQANVMVERLVGSETQDVSLSQDEFDAKVTQRRTSLAVTNRDFALLRDVDYAHRHLVRREHTLKLVSRADQTCVEETGGAIGEAAFGEVPLGGGNPEIVVKLDDGTQRPLALILKNVVQMWVEELRAIPETRSE